MIDCLDCVYGFLDCCGTHRNNAACLTMQRPWRDEPKEKLLEYVERRRKYEVEQFNQKLKRLNAIEEEIKR